LRPPANVEYTVNFASWLSTRQTWQVAEGDGLTFRYVDRELDCMRTSPGVPLEDGTKSKKALVLDLLLADAHDGTPIAAELKIRDDEDPFYGLVQALAAAAHLVTAAQRTRLRNVYGLTAALRDGGPYFDVYAIFFEPPVAGLWPEILEETLALRDDLLAQAEVATLVRRIELLIAELCDGQLLLRRAESLRRRADRDGVWAGVDVGGRAKGFHVALIDDTTLLDYAHLLTVSATAAWLAERRPSLVAIDSPRSPAPQGESSRPGERALAAAGISNIRYTPTYYERIEHGFELYEACTAADLAVIECFPTASWIRWAGARGNETRAVWTTGALRAQGVRDVPARTNQDQRDAIGAALTARAHELGTTESFGDIVVPVAAVAADPSARRKTPPPRDDLALKQMNRSRGDGLSETIS